MSYCLRPMTEEDAPILGQIEKDAFPTLWPPTPFRREMHNRLARYLVAWEASAPAPPQAAPLPSASPSRPGNWRWPLLSRLLPRSKNAASAVNEATAAHNLVGFEGIWFMTDEAHITAIGVRSSHRGKGVGELLLIGALELAYLRRSRVATLECRVSNHVAQSLYRKYGFQDQGIRKGYYVDNNEDALIMTTSPITTPEYRATFLRLVQAHQERWGPSTRGLGS